MQEYSVPKKMKRVGDLFGKYRVLFKAPQATVEKECVLVLTEVCKYPVSIEQVKYTVSNRTVSLQLPSLLKTELKFQHQLILKKLEERLGKNGAPKVIR